MASQPDSFLDDQSTLEKLARMQHFSLPTRLLDVTWNPLVALYFCVKDEQNSDGDVVVIGVSRNDDKFFDSDTASCVANLAYMNPRERNAIRHAPDMKNFDGSEGKVRSFNEEKEVSRLLHFVKSEKPYFSPEIIPSDLKRNLLVRPKLNNRRIVAQNGAFILFGLRHESLEKNPDNFKIDKIRIEAKHKRDLQKELDLFGFNDQAMFSELESASKYIRSKFG
ncbi:FRG domain-containing protein [Acidocella sp.]|uniref:FRG domain-containing protein n=1 Tax=Acidocella sp. TaxID=50710 RepID=UPI002636CED6|nr:FRG domain-containing protein [Acidocella sp.]